VTLSNIESIDGCRSSVTGLLPLFDTPVGSVRHSLSPTSPDFQGPPALGPAAFVSEGHVDLGSP
jgi:hypothetical protein